MLIVSNLVAVLGWFQSHQSIVLVPPWLDDRVEISADDASVSYKRAWAHFVAMQMGNVSPGNADFVRSAVEGLMSPGTFRTLQQALTQQVADIKADSLTVSFEPNEILHEVATDKVFVYGRFQSEGPTGEPHKFMRTFEMTIDIRFGRPWVMQFAVYAGEPHTQAWLQLQGLAE